MKFTVLMKFDERTKDYYESNRMVYSEGAKPLRLDEINRVSDTGKETTYYAMRLRGSWLSFVQHYLKYGRTTTIYPNWY